VDVMVNGRLVAKGEVVVIEDNFGVRLTEILNPQERISRLGDAA
jgi:flagellar motor switch protein FliN/FliY